MALSPLAQHVRAVFSQIMRSIKIDVEQHTNTNAGMSSSPGCPAPVRTFLRKGPGNASNLRRTFKTVNAEDIYPEILRRLE